MEKKKIGMGQCALVLVAVFFVTIMAADAADAKHAEHAEHADRSVRQVCTIGGGIGGMAASVFLKDLGYDVVVLEREPVLGGCCNTVTFPAPPGQQQNWLDPGVEAFLNTTFGNSIGWGPWTVDTEAFFRRFVPDASWLIPVPFPPDTPSFAADLARGISYGLQTGAPSPDFGAAVGRLLAIYARYPWLDTALNKPDPLPAELLVSFADLIAGNSLEPLLPFLQNVIYNGGMGNYSALTAMYALMNVAPSVLLGILQPPGNGGFFALKGGCIQAYDGMHRYLGAENVITNARIERLVRPPAGHGHLASVLVGRIEPSADDHNHHDAQPFTYFCDHVVVGIVPTTSDLSEFMDLDAAETAVFDRVLRRFYYATTVDVEGPIAHNAPGYFLLTNVDMTTPFDLPVTPTVGNMFRGVPYGPVAAPSFSDTPISDTAMHEVIQSRLDNIPPSLLTRATLTRVFPHVFQAHFPAADLARSPSPYTAFDALQNHRNTLWSGNANSFPDHAHIINAAYLLISAHFAPLPGTTRSSPPLVRSQ